MFFSLVELEFMRIELPLSERLKIQMTSRNNLTNVFCNIRNTFAKTTKLTKKTINKMSEKALIILFFSLKKLHVSVRKNGIQFFFFQWRMTILWEMLLFTTNFLSGRLLVILIWIYHLNFFLTHQSLQVKNYHLGFVVEKKKAFL